MKILFYYQISCHKHGPNKNTNINLKFKGQSLYAKELNALQSEIKRDE